jgi:uncharacterized membrane protein
MAGVSEITSNALEVARKGGDQAKQLTDADKMPKRLAAASAAMVALPLAAEGVAKLADGIGNGKASKAGEKAKRKAAGKAKKLAGEVAEEKLKPSMPKGLGAIGGLFGGSSDSDSAGEGEETTSAHGEGRRMPIQQSVDVAVPIDVAYNLWTQFEDWPSFMHRVDSAEQLDETTISFTTKVWGITKRFKAQINEQHPDERIEWDVKDGLQHAGVVTFHKLAPRLTRIEMSLDVKPDSLLEKAGRGMRFTKRAARGDLHRFKAFAEMENEAKSGWRGTIEDGEVKRKTERKARKPKSRSKGSSRPSSGGKRNGSSNRSRARSHS